MDNQLVQSDLELVLLASPQIDADEVLAGLILLFGASRTHACQANDFAERAQELSQQNAVWVLLPSSQEQFINWVHQLQVFGIQNQRIVTLCRSNQNDILDFCHKNKFSFELLEHLDPAQIGHKILDAWQEFTNGILLEELYLAQDFGALAMLAERTGKKMNTLLERARLAYGLASCLSSDQNFIRRSIRLALFQDIQQLPAWGEIVRQSRHLWWVNDLLQVVNVAEQWVPENPLEVNLVLTCRLLQDEAGQDENNFRMLLRERSALLHFQMRTNLRLATERAFKKIWLKGVKHVA